MKRRILRDRPPSGSRPNVRARIDRATNPPPTSSSIDSKLSPFNHSASVILSPSAKSAACRVNGLNIPVQRGTASPLRSPCAGEGVDSGPRLVHHLRWGVATAAEDTRHGRWQVDRRTGAAADGGRGRPAGDAGALRGGPLPPAAGAPGGR